MLYKTMFMIFRNKGSVYSIGDLTAELGVEMIISTMIITLTMLTTYPLLRPQQINTVTVLAQSYMTFVYA